MTLDKTHVGSFPRRKTCRFTGAPLESLMDLGSQALTGVFPKSAEDPVSVTPLELAWCPSSGLVQLAHDYPGELMYGETYGYRSGLNASMVRHLDAKIQKLETAVRPLEAGDVVLDIGANDATSLKAYRTAGIKRIGIDPSAAKFKRFYPDDIALEVDFFSKRAFEYHSSKKARIVTSIAMFYDLPDPVSFVRDVAAVLADDGIWHFEQSYLPLMMSQLAYDTVCQEHLEYYSLSVVKDILAAADMKIIDVEMNLVNGGSFAVTATHARNTCLTENRAAVEKVLQEEEDAGLLTSAPYQAFAERSAAHARKLKEILTHLKASGKRIMGLGASTKGNVILQYAGIGADLLDAVSDVNPDKWGCVTPGTHIPIVPEAVARAAKPDYFLVLPWHFRDGIVEREAEFLARGGKLLFPLPNIEFVAAGDAATDVPLIRKVSL
ncbi:class I SAM-dependent methyltransferase [Ponticaulis profundi]|uniref:Class I SAM-dependent methyltransferase n=1 Tax=Ponticaulis profundi TaxID=2665222 RepID=A0ABW1S6N7_9PROT